MLLFFGEDSLGEIHEVTGEYPWMTGTFSPGKKAARFRKFFRWMVDEDNNDKEPPFAPELLEEENWSVLDDSGGRKGISIPAVYEDGTIMWRWR